MRHRSMVQKINRSNMIHNSRLGFWRATPPLYVFQVLISLWKKYACGWFGLVGTFSGFFSIHSYMAWLSHFWNGFNTVKTANEISIFRRFSYLNKLFKTYHGFAICREVHHPSKTNYLLISSNDYLFIVHSF